MSLTNEESLRFERIHPLVTKQLDGTASEADRRELEKAISTDSGMRDEYIRSIQEAVQISARLVYSYPACDKSKPNSLTFLLPGSSPALRVMPRWVPLIAICASLISVVFLVAWIRDQGLPRQKAGNQEVGGGVVQRSAELGSSPVRSVAKLEREVATLVQCNGVTWESQASVISELSRVTAGQNLCFLKGRVKLVFDSGVEALVLGPCQMSVVDRDRVYCDYGRITLKASVAGRGFVVETPVVRVTDLGTEFGMAISESGETEVAVFQGEVDVELNSASGESKSEFQAKRERLVQGQAAFVDNHGKSRRLFSIDNQRLPGVRDLAPLHQQQQVISSVRDNMIDRQHESRMFYRIVQAGLREDSLAYVDRDHQWNGLTSVGMPQELIGADYVMPFNEDKLVGDLRVRVSIARAANLYIFFSDNTAVPAWLSSRFVDTGMDLGLDEGPSPFKRRKKVAIGPGMSIDNTFSIWKCEIDGPQELELGSFQRPEGFRRGYNMYGIAAVAK